MPELPEVETIVRDLNNQLKNKKILAIESRDKKVWQVAAGELKNILGKKINAVKRRAKMIVIDLGERYLIMHLKMTGQLVYKNKVSLIAGGQPTRLPDGQVRGEGKELPNRFTRVIFKFNDRSALYFNDVRRFGWIKLAARDKFIEFNGSLGLEPLSSDFTLEYFNKILSPRPKTSIKQALLEQKYIAGIGNIYADEALFAAGIKPFRRVKTLKPAEIKKLWLAIPKVLRSAIKHRGTSFNDYVDAQGETGNFIKYLKVYGRAREDCKNCGQPVKKIKLGGRGTHWCDNCQK
ncbi:MAG: bifunctional DNA-formamidopyrimidine glycosylase/DNA-(apurinic or apyrimidinic site) lyase [Parcubacteria group bacterium]|nr:bifunctional DNA-formamidopyrimidine glycosylase/DNA-(apurinic or apyrimidinic site) lyase [Parcubacteria group bacterium]